jgi:hypothetical protein
MKHSASCCGNPALSVTARRRESIGLNASLLILWLASALVSRAQIITPPTEPVYQNAASPSQRPAAYYSSSEVGDEIRLAGGEARKVTDFGFLYYGDFSGSGVTATLRLYKNDGVDADPGDHLVPAPGTLLYESDPLNLQAGYHEALVSGLALDVPASLTWTVSFSGSARPPGIGRG